LFLLLVLFFLIWTQGFSLAKQVLLPLEPSSPVILKMVVSWIICQGWLQTEILLISSARIPGGSHLHLTDWISLFQGPLLPHGFPWYMQLGCHTICTGPSLVNVVKYLRLGDFIKKRLI
jgi:hypothetical protein